MSKQEKGKKVLVAMSGGVDSSVSAYLLMKKGYRVEAAFMKNWSSAVGLVENSCPWLADRREALKAAAFLGIRLHTLDFQRQYRDLVMERFFADYAAGRTPNPDVLCNKEIKFSLLYGWAIKHGFDYLATGHYAAIRPGPRPALLRSADEFKDQTYFIYHLDSSQLPHLLFPVGGMTKSRVRAMAAKIGLPNSGRKESMGLCFVGKIRLKDFLGQRLPLKKGPIFSLQGKELGSHDGLHQFTIGQRQGIRVGAGGPYYVARKDLAANALYVTTNPDDPALLLQEARLEDFHWIDGSDAAAGKGQYLGRCRHQGELAPLSLRLLPDGQHLARFRRPQKALASGQSLVIYRGRQCLGGGVVA